MRAGLRAASLLAVLLLLAGCAMPGAAARARVDYGPYVASDPRSVVVAPVVSPMNGAAREWLLATITEPLAERGYYVFPVRMGREVGAKAGFTGRGPDGMGFEEFSEERAAELASVFGADSVLFVHVKAWGRKVEDLALDSFVTNSVGLDYRLTDERGQTLWTAEQQVSLTTGGGNFLTMLWNLFTDPDDEERQLQLAREVHRMAIEGKPNEMGKRRYTRPAPMLVGPYHPRYERDRAKRRGQQGP